MIVKATLAALCVAVFWYCQTTDESDADNDLAAEDGEGVWVNAKVYTGVAAKPWADAIAFKGGKITAVGTKEEVLKVAGEGADQTDMEQSLVMPGFQDPHVHLPEAGINSDMCVFSRETSLATYEKEVSAL